MFRQLLVQVAVTKYSADLLLARTFRYVFFFFKVVNRLVLVNEHGLPRIRRPARQTRFNSKTIFIKYIQPKCKFSTVDKQSFTVRTIKRWNTLAEALSLSMENLGSFKSVMFKYYFRSLQATYYPENLRTFKTISLKCNTSRNLTLPLICCY